MTIEEYVEDLKKTLTRKNGRPYVAELNIKSDPAKKWWGYIWLFDGTSGTTYLVTKSCESIIDVLLEMEKEINNDRDR